MDLQEISRKRYSHTMLWAVLACCLIVAIAATFARAMFNFQAALTDKPDVAIYLLLEEEGVGETKLLREEPGGGERHYYAETETGPKLVILKRNEERWFVASMEDLRE